jgi:hypothetical protein
MRMAIQDVGMDRNRKIEAMLRTWLLKPGPLAVKIVSADATIADLERKAAECEAKAKSESEPAATDLGEMADLCREWMAKLRSGEWIS